MWLTCHITNTTAGGIKQDFSVFPNFYRHGTKQMHFASMFRVVLGILMTYIKEWNCDFLRWVLKTKTYKLYIYFADNLGDIIATVQITFCLFFLTEELFILQTGLHQFLLFQSSHRFPRYQSMTKGIMEVIHIDKCDATARNHTELCSDLQTFKYL